MSGMRVTLVQTSPLATILVERTRAGYRHSLQVLRCALGSTVRGVGREARIGRKYVRTGVSTASEAHTSTVDRLSRGGKSRGIRAFLRGFRSFARDVLRISFGKKPALAYIHDAKASW